MVPLPDSGSREPLNETTGAERPQFGMHIYTHHYRSIKHDITPQTFSYILLYLDPYVHNIYLTIAVPPICHGLVQTLPWMVLQKPESKDLAAACPAGWHSRQSPQVVGDQQESKHQQVAPERKTHVLKYYNWIAHHMMHSSNLGST